MIEEDGFFKTCQHIWNQWLLHVSEDVLHHFSDGYTVTFGLIQLAIYMGFVEIYFHGVDFSYSVMHDENSKLYRDESTRDYFTGMRYDATIFNYNSMLHTYQIAKEYCDNYDILIQNTIRGRKIGNV